MRKRIKVLSGAVLVILSLFASPVLATSVTWQRTGDLRSSGFVYPNQIFALSSYGETIFAGTDLGLFESNNGGSDWSELYRTYPPTDHSVDSRWEYYAMVYGIRGLPSSQVNSLVFDPTSYRTSYQTIYAGIHGGGVYKSIDNGATWIAANNGLTNTHINALAIDPSNPLTLYVGTSGGVFKTFNGGISWIATNEGMAGVNVMALAIDPTAPQTVYVGTNGGSGLYKTINGGISWTMANGGLTSTVFSLAIDPTNSQTIYAGGSSGVRRSINGGYSWSGTGPQMQYFGYISSLAIDPFNSQTIYAGSSGPHTISYVYKGLYILDVPTISSTPDTIPTTIAVGTAFSFTPSSTDASSFRITGGVPPGMTFDTTTGTLSGTPTATGIYNIVITVINASGSASLPVFTINVAPKPVSVPIMEGWWLFPGILAGVGIFARRRKD